MVPRTRRRLLQGAGALLAGLAGCQEGSSGTSSSNDLGDAENVETDPEFVGLRNPAAEPVAWVGTDESDDSPPTPEGSDESPPVSERRPRITRREDRLIDSEATAALLRYADVDGVGTARTFVDETDFERETLLLETRLVEECYRLELCVLTWSSTSYHTYFGRYLRPADAACRVDAIDRVSWLIRIPDTLDPDLVRSRGSGTSGSGCRGYRRRIEDVRTETTTGSTSESGSSPEPTRGSTPERTPRTGPGGPR